MLKQASFREQQFNDVQQVCEPFRITHFVAVWYKARKSIRSTLALQSQFFRLKLPIAALADHVAIDLWHARFATRSTEYDAAALVNAQENHA